MNYMGNEDWVPVDTYIEETRYLEQVISELRDEVEGLMEEINYLEDLCKKYAERIQELENEKPL